MNEKEMIMSWKSRLPEGLIYGVFDEDFMIEGRHYRHGAWTWDGDWFLAWDTERDFAAQIAEL